jgi:hypothetical protein
VPDIIKVLESPSKQKKVDFCRLLLQLNYNERWEPREAERSLPARLRGTALARGAEIIHKAIRDGDRELLQNTSFMMACVDESIALFDRQFKYCVEAGISFPPNVDATSRAELRRVIPLYARYTPLLSWQKITGVERSIPEYSCRPDVEGVNARGFDVVGDIKYKSSLPSEYESSTIEEFHWDPQVLQYNHAERHILGRGPNDNVYSTLLLVVGSPFRIKEVEWLYTPEKLQLWFESAKDLTQAIRDIKEGRALPRAATVHRNNFGWCPMKKACLEYNLDPELMKRDYVQIDNMPE